MFVEANWPPNPSSTSRLKVEAPLHAAALGTDKSNARSGVMASRVEKSENDIKEYSVVHETRRFSTSTDASTEKQQASKKLSASNKVPEDIALDALPQSLADIYNISNRNKWRNKDKKRNRDVAEVASPSVLDVAESSQSGDWYHVEKGKDSRVSDNVEGSLDIAAQVGWIGNDASSRNETKRNHVANESYNISAAGSSSSQQEHSAMSGADSTSSSFDSKKSAKGSKQSYNKDKNTSNKELNHGYDYSRSSAMGAMSTVNTGPSGGDAGKYNPFVSGSTGGGNGGYSNASNRGNNNNALKARKQATGGGKSKHNPTVVERRETNRSHIFSASTNK